MALDANPNPKADTASESCLAAALSKHMQALKPAAQANRLSLYTRTQHTSTRTCQLHVSSTNNCTGGMTCATPQHIQGRLQIIEREQGSHPAAANAAAARVVSCSPDTEAPSLLLPLLLPPPLLLLLLLDATAPCACCCTLPCCCDGGWCCCPCCCKCGMLVLDS